MEHIIKTRIPDKLYEQMRELCESNGTYINDSDFLRQAIRFFIDEKRKQPRRIEKAIEALSALIENGPEGFKKMLREEIE